MHKRCCSSCGDKGAEVSLVGPAIALIPVFPEVVTSALVFVAVKGTLLVTPTVVVLVLLGATMLLFRLWLTVLEQEAVRERLFVCWSASSLSVTSFVLVRN